MRSEPLSAGRDVGCRGRPRASPHARQDVPPQKSHPAHCPFRAIGLAQGLPLHSSPRRVGGCNLFIYTGRLFSDKVRLIYLQLPYFTKDVDECDTLFDRWIYVLKNMTVLERMPWAAQDAVFQKLASIAEVAALSKEDRQLYDESLRKFRDTIVVMESQRAEGRAEGLAQGREEGLAQGREEGRSEERMSNARSLKEHGVPVDLIVQSLNLTPDEALSL